MSVVSKLNSRVNAHKVAAQWKDQYCTRGRWDTYAGWRRTPQAIHAALMKLGTSTTAKQVARTIGNSTWTFTQCSVSGCSRTGAVNVVTRLSVGGIPICGLHAQQIAECAGWRVQS